MAHVSLYALSVPPLIRGLENISAILTLASSHRTASSLLNARLYHNMRDLTYQVYRITDYCLGLLCSRFLALPNIPQMSEPERSTFEGLEARITTTINFMKTVPQEAFANKDDRVIALRPPKGWNGNVQGNEKNVQQEVRYHGAADYLGNFVMPSFWFHACMVYAILRAQGLEIGKHEFVNAAGGMDITVVEE